MNLAGSVEYLRRQQRTDGRFMGYVSPRLKPFSTAREQPTIFPTALILDCLQMVTGTEDIRQQAAEYLKHEVTPHGSWNYWDTGCQQKTDEPYPDDLDDTACVLAALSRQDPAWVDSGRLGQFARLLVAAEQSTGGPYNTWLIDTAAAPQWRHIEAAVNANIGYALSLHGVLPAGLRDYLENAIKGSKYRSDYYVGELPVMYFLSRWYQGEKLTKLKADVVNFLIRPLPTSALQQALLLTAACRLELPPATMQPLADKLQASRLKGHWPAAAFYIDPVYDGQQHYGGSAALTTALALEALSHFAETHTKASKVGSTAAKPLAMTQSERDAVRIPNRELKNRYLDMARRVTSGPDGEQVSSAASLVATALPWPVTTKLTNQLDSASLNGWIAYTLFDDLIDDDPHIEKLNVASIALRRSYGYFLQVGGSDSDYSEHVRQVFDTIDSANDWELHHTRPELSDGVLSLRALPDYGDYSQLAERSLGHSLAACGVFWAHFGSMEHPQLVALQSFFKHFLIARQINDDAHDWEADLRAGQLSAAVALLLKDSKIHRGKVIIEQRMDELRLRFWQQTIEAIAALIDKHAAAARSSLADFEPTIDTGIFDSWLIKLEAAAASALQNRDDALKFMAAYEGTHV